ncbi:MAG: spermidine synthase [Armatimonadota bacterium]
MLFLYAFTLFISAAMLFAVELMFTKMVLPLLGGTPAVWNTCSVFFQIALLAGYAYAHLLSSKLKVRHQLIMHLGLMLLPLIVLPIALPHGWQPPGGANPIPWLLLLMAITVGLPFAVVSTSAPLIQRWFAHTDHPAAADPYFLYAASNTGSFVGLVGYIAFLEPNFTISQQSIIWKYGYIGLLALTAVCALTVWRSFKHEEKIPESTDGAKSGIPYSADYSPAPTDPPVTLARKLRWLMLAFIPSSLMLGLTTHLTTDIASVPLLWVVPLALYLLTFVIAFSRREYIKQSFLVKLLPILVLVQTVGLAKTPMNLLWLILIPLPTFFVAALTCHRELVNDRPSSSQLTEFYLLMSAGGMIGGMFNALAAPLIFSSIAEYPIVLVLAAVFCLIPGPGTSKKERHEALSISYTDTVWVLGVSLISMSLLHYAMIHNIAFNSLIMGLAMSFISVLCYFTIKKPIRFGICVGVVIFFIEVSNIGGGAVLCQERSFFGVARVKYEPYWNAHQLVHGTTLHGMQYLDTEYKDMPSTYYFHSGPLGQMFQTFSGDAAKKNVAVVGLGTGTVSCFANKGQNFTFYEIDRTVQDIALDPKYFTFFTDAEKRGANMNIVLGDARLSIADAPDKSYDLIILDAFSSDSVPMHLVTRQALQLYLTKLKDHGIIVFHLSNRYLKLRPVFSNLIDAEGLAGIVRRDDNISAQEQRMGKVRSEWLLVARDMADFSTLVMNPGWEKTVKVPGKPIWTDDYSNILSVLKW